MNSGTGPVFPLNREDGYYRFTYLFNGLLLQTRGRSLSLTRGEIHISLRYEVSRSRLNVIVLKATNLLKTSKFLTTGKSNNNS